MREAWCAGKPVQVRVRPQPVNAVRVRCASCGAEPGRECTDLVSGLPTYASHASRQRRAELLALAEAS